MAQAGNFSLTFYRPGQASCSPRRQDPLGIWPAQGDNGQCSWVPGLSRAICGEREACLLPPCLLSPHYLWMRTMLEIK